MEFRRKTVALMSVIIIASFLVGNVMVAVAPEMGLDELWDAIFGIEEDVAELEAQVGIQAQIDEMEGQIDDLQVETGTLRELLDFLEDQWIPGPEGPEGPPGPQGEKGDTGEPGFGLEPIGYLSIPAAAFTPAENGSGYNNLGGYVDNLDEHWIAFSAPVFLPNGVRVNNLTMYAGDVIAGKEVVCELYRGGSGGGVMASTSSVENGLTSITYDDSIVLDIIDNTQYTYYLWITIPETTTPFTVLFYYAIIEYEYLP